MTAIICRCGNCRDCLLHKIEEKNRTIKELEEKLDREIIRQKYIPRKKK